MLIAQLQIGKKLRLMNWCNRACFQLQNHTVFDQYVNAVTHFQPDTVVNNRQRHLLLNVEPSLSKFVS